MPSSSLKWLKKFVLHTQNRIYKGIWVYLIPPRKTIMIVSSSKYFIISSWFCVYLYYMKKKSNSLVVLENFCFLHRLEFQMCFNDCSIHIAHHWGCSYIAFLCGVISDVSSICIMTLGKTLLPDFNLSV